jgi:two-component system, LuxR family, response regulator FixJ
MTLSEKHICIVDDDISICRAIQRTLAHLRVQSACFERAVDCIAHLQAHPCDLLITDVQMPDVDGLELLNQVKQLIPWLPVLIVTGYADIPLAIRAVKCGAADLIEKPLERESFLHKVCTLIETNQSPDIQLGKALTKAELGILHYVMDGLSSKEIANILHRSPRTIEFHRQHIMRKLGVSNVVELVKRVSQMGITLAPDTGPMENHSDG